MSDEEADAVQAWLKLRMTFRLGTDEATELTMNRCGQHKMYIAALRIAMTLGARRSEFNISKVSDLAPASDLVEGLLNNVTAHRHGHATARASSGR